MAASAIRIPPTFRLGRALHPIEIAATLASAAGVWLTARRSVWSWPVSLVGIVLYAWVFFEARLYSDTLLQGAFAAASVYGWIQWRRASAGGGTVAVATPGLWHLAVGMLVGAAGAAALGAAMAGYTDAAAPWLDAALTAFSLVAQWWTARRYLVSWWLWMGLDVVYVGLFIGKQLYPTAVLYAAFVALAAYGLAGWQRAARDG